MAVELVELAGRVFEVELLPDARGTDRHTLTVRVLSGPLLSEEEAERTIRAVIASVQEQGGRVTRTQRD